MLIRMMRAMLPVQYFNMDYVDLHDAGDVTCPVFQHGPPPRQQGRVQISGRVDGHQCSIDCLTLVPAVVPVAYLVKVCNNFVAVSSPKPTVLVLKSLNNN